VAALVCVIFSGLLGSAFLYGFSEAIGNAFESQFILLGIQYLSPGIFFFVVNKVLIWIFNGKRQMKQFAVASSIRAVNIFLLCLWIIFYREPYQYFGLAFTISELLLFICIVFLKPVKISIQWNYLGKWISTHCQFGSKSVIHGLLSEAFIRIDVLVLGIFLSDHLVGIYSFAAFFVEGIYQVPVVIRNLNNPILVKLLLEKNIKEIITFNRKTALLSFVLTFLASLTVALIYPHLDLIFPAETINRSYPVLLCLLAGMVIYSNFVPFDYIFLTGGFPGIQSFFMFSNTTVNIGLNFYLIPIYGLIGACLATVISFMFASVLLNILSALMLNLPSGIFIK